VQLCVLCGLCLWECSKSLTTKATEGHEGNPHLREVPFVQLCVLCGLCLWECSKSLTTKATKGHEGNPHLREVPFVQLCVLCGLCLYAFTTLPLRKQEVHTRRRLVEPPTLARTGRRLTFHRRLLTLWAWLMLFPDCGPLPQTSQTRAMSAPDKFRT